MFISQFHCARLDVSNVWPASTFMCVIPTWWTIPPSDENTWTATWRQLNKPISFHKKKRTTHVKLWTLLNFCEAEEVFDHKLGKLTEAFLKQQLQADISCCSSWNLHSAYAVPLDKLSWFAVGLMLLLLWTAVHRWALLMERNFCRCFAALCVPFFTFLIRASLRETVTGLQNTFKL